MKKQTYSPCLKDESKVYTNLCVSPLFLDMEWQYQIVSELLTS